jgi:hypothetical protein
MIQPRIATTLLAAALTLATFAPAWALDPPPTDPDKCGGLVCDLGLFKGRRDPHALPCNDFLCRTFGGTQAPPPAPEPAVTAPLPEPVKPTRHAKAHHAGAKTLASAKTPAESKAPDAASAGPEAAKPQATQ